MPWSTATALRELEVTPEMERRRDELGAVLAANGMALRDDSRMSYEYIARGGNLQATAHELLCVNFLFQHTRYESLLVEAMRYYANDIHERYNRDGGQISWNDTWIVVREYCVPAMKLYALAQAGVSFPHFDVAPPGGGAPGDAPGDDVCPASSEA